MRWLITGGAGFIGCNVAAHLVQEGIEVVVLDNLSRAGARANLEWLRTQGPVTFLEADVRDFDALTRAFRSQRRLDVVLHLAAQVAVTTSVANPREDFEVNALGTFNLCEAVRHFAPEAALLNAATNKVYGEMAHLGVVERDGRYEYVDRPYGVGEDEPVDFHSPYGCSKGSGEQYVRDYARIYGLRTVSFRQSCIYGPRQFGVEDQGWVAWFTIAALLDRPITIYGDGRQVRDVLFVDDLVDCYLTAAAQVDAIRGRVYNVGGGPDNTLSLLELLALLEASLGKPIPRSYADWRPGDQRVFVCDIRRIEADLGWKPRVAKDVGVRRLIEWVRDNRALFEPR
jgi:CDP-paratose 2-epimerase